MCPLEEKLRNLVTIAVFLKDFEKNPAIVHDVLMAIARCLEKPFHQNFGPASSQFLLKFFFVKTPLKRAILCSDIKANLK